MSDGITGSRQARANALRLWRTVANPGALWAALELADIALEEGYAAQARKTFAKYIGAFRSSSDGTGYRDRIPTPAECNAHADRYPANGEDSGHGLVMVADGGIVILAIRVGAPDTFNEGVVECCDPGSIDTHLEHWEALDQYDGQSFRLIDCDGTPVGWPE